LSTKAQQIEWRRDRVMELSSQGFNQSDIAFALKVDRSIICRDVAYLKHQAQENLQYHIYEVIPAEYEKAMNSLNQVLRLTWAIVGKTPDEKTRLQALSLITECNKYRLDLASNGTIVNDALKTFQDKMDSLNKQSVKECEPETKTDNKTTTNTIF
jgi:hypothetical protein